MRFGRWVLAFVVAGCTAQNESLRGGRDDAEVAGHADGGAPDADRPADAGGGADLDAAGGGVSEDAAPPADAALACAAGRVERRACGLNGAGESTRVCRDGGWSAFGACNDPDECVAGAREAEPCDPDPGVRTRRCDAGEWSDWSACEVPADCDDGDEEADVCGVNGRGRQFRTCEDGAWGAWGPCEGDGVCPDGRAEARACGPGDQGEQSRRCVEGAWSDWGPCEGGGDCVGGAVESRACGLNGRGDEVRRCVQGVWSPWGACADPDVCSDGRAEARPCGLNGRGEEVRRCVGGAWGPWGVCADPDVCRDGARENRACEGNGTQARACAAGRWGAWGACERPPPGGCQPIAAVVAFNGPGEQTVRTDTSGLAGAHGASCGGAAAGPEAIIQLDLAVPLYLEIQVMEATFDTVVHLRSSCADPATELGCDDDSGAGTHSLLDRRLPAGRTFLFVDGFRADARGVARTRITARREEILPRCDPAQSAQCRQCTDRLEPNDRAEAARRVVPPVREAGLTLCPDLDRNDHYVMNVVRPTFITAEAQPVGAAQGEYSMFLRDAADQHLGLGGVGGRAYALVVAPGDYRLHLDGVGLQAPLTYDLSVTTQVAPACEWTNDAPDCVRCRDALDPNDAIASAALIETGRVYDTLAVCKDLDQDDYFAFEAPGAGTYRAEITRHFELGDTYLAAKDRNGAQLNNQGNGLGNRLWTDFPVPGPGRYYVQVRSAGGMARYSLSVTRR